MHKSTHDVMNWDKCFWNPYMLYNPLLMRTAGLQGKTKPLSMWSSLEVWWHWSPWKMWPHNFCNRTCVTLEQMCWNLWVRCHCSQRLFLLEAFFHPLSPPFTIQLFWGLLVLSSLDTQGAFCLFSFPDAGDAAPLGAVHEGDGSHSGNQQFKEALHWVVYTSAF